MHLPDALQKRLAADADANMFCPAIGRVADAFDQTLALQAFQKDGDVGKRHIKLPRQLPLGGMRQQVAGELLDRELDRKSTRLNSSHRT